MSRRTSRLLTTPRLTQLEDRSTPAAFNPGTIQGQGGWSGGSVDINPNVVQGVDQGGGLARSGTGSFVVSNSTANGGGFNGGFNGWPFSPALSVTSGQPSSGAMADTFTATIWFRSVSSTADGSNIEIDLGESGGTDRNSILGIANMDDADFGLQLYVLDPQQPNGGLAPTPVVDNMPRGQWHRLDLVATFRDGP
ncbi:MAG: hypothetical protein MUF18_20975, partial [Fimbriiglobus sp.]|nr:hypothetical protein [Fimbriiglobus sp.]